MSGAHRVTWWGGFDPYTFGVWISEDKVHDFRDPVEIDRLYLLAMAAAPTDEHKEFVDACATTEERVLAVTAFTAYVHEWRHWYDLTSTPFGMVRLGQLAAFYGTLVSLEPVVDNLRTVFVPLERWARLPDLINVGFGLDPLPPEATSILTNAMKVLRKAEFARKATRPIGRITISTHQILESLAMLEQEQHVERHFGPAAATELRRSVLDTGPGGRAYYAPAKLVEGAIGTSDRKRTIAILESTLFVDYGVLGSTTELSPPALLEVMLPGLRDHAGEDLGTYLDQVIEQCQGFNRSAALDHCYAVAAKTLDQILDAGEHPDTTAGARRVRAHLGVCLKDAFMWGSAARQWSDSAYDLSGDLRQLAKNFGGSTSLPMPDPYSLRPVVLVEGNPGRTAPVADDTFFHTLAGSVGPAWAYASLWTDGAVPNDVGPDALLQQSVVWTPKVDNYPNYFGLLNVFRDLMYWRGVVLGPGTISPFTFFSTTLADAEEKGQRLVGPDLLPAWTTPAPEPGPGSQADD